ncbi:MAG: radical SAM protein [Desulfamplus sp.]|nr:radical SAM protein [Desulfamplus sp.]
MQSLSSQKSQNSSKPLVIPIFIPHLGCPHQCAFCNQSIITKKDNTSDIPSEGEIRKIVDNFLQYRGSRADVELAFFGGNFLGLKPNQITSLLLSGKMLADEKKIDSIRFSTRPETITKDRFELIAQYPVTTIEIGVQSMDNRVLKAARRGHTAEDTINAITLLRKSCHIYKQNQDTMQDNKIDRKVKSDRLKIGIQMMVGLPEDSKDSAIETAKKIASFKPDFVRIYPLIVLEKSPIAKWYRQGKYEPLSLDGAVGLVKEIFLIFQKRSIPVIRMGLQASDLLEDRLSMVAGPWHPAFGHLVYSEIFFDKALNLIEKSSFAKDRDKIKTITLSVHPSSISRLIGDKSYNIKRLKEIYPSIELKIKTDSSLDSLSLKKFDEI